MIDANKTVADLVTVTGRLTDILDRETGILKRLEPQALKELQGDKSSLTDMYETQVRLLANDPESFGATERELREELRDVTVLFHEVVARNTRALDAARKVNRKLIEAVIDAVQNQRAADVGYDSAGALDLNPVTGAHQPSLVVDQRL